MSNWRRCWSRVPGLLASPAQSSFKSQDRMRKKRRQSVSSLNLGDLHVVWKVQSRMLLGDLPSFNHKPSSTIIRRRCTFFSSVRDEEGEWWRIEDYCFDDDLWRQKYCRRGWVFETPSGIHRLNEQICVVLWKSCQVGSVNMGCQLQKRRASSRAA